MEVLSYYKLSILCDTIENFVMSTYIYGHQEKKMFENVQRRATHCPRNDTVIGENP